MPLLHNPIAGQASNELNASSAQPYFQLKMLTSTTSTDETLFLYALLLNRRRQTLFFYLTTTVPAPKHAQARPSTPGLQRLLGYSDATIALPGRKHKRGKCSVDSIGPTQGHVLGDVLLGGEFSCHVLSLPRGWGTLAIFSLTIKNWDRD